MPHVQKLQESGYHWVIVYLHCQGEISLTVVKVPRLGFAEGYMNNDLKGE